MIITEYCQGFSLRNMVESTATLDSEFTVVTADKFFYEYLGSNSEIPFHLLILEEDRPSFMEAVSKLSEGPQHLLLRMMDPKEGYRYYKVRIATSPRKLKETPCIDVVIYDIYAMEGRYPELQYNVRKYRRYMAELDQYYFEYDCKTRIFKIFTYANDKANMILVTPIDEFAKMMNEQYLKEEKSKRQFLTFMDYLEDGVDNFRVLFSTTLLSKAGRVDILAFQGSTFYFMDEKRLVIGTMTSMNRNKVENAYYQTDAAKDSATGLFNKKAMIEYCKDRLKLKECREMAMIIVDIDNFKHYNDTYGHLFGDEIINKIVAIMKSVVGAGGVVGRFGGDEFIIVLENYKDLEEVQRIIHTIMNHMKYAYKGIKDEIDLTASIGVSLYPQVADSYEDLFAKADKALYIVKQNGKNNCLFYDPKLHEKVDVAEAVLRHRKLASVLSDVVIDSVMLLHEGGASAIPGVLKNICEVTEISGIHIYTGEELRRDYSEGNFEISFDSAYDFANESYFKQFNENHLFKIRNIEEIERPYAALYDACVRSDVQAMFQHVTYRGEKPVVFISYDVFNHAYSWSEGEENLFHMLSRMLARVLMDSARMGEFLNGLGMDDLLTQSKK
ncbi:MAG: GGDEF domain-containing protein [Lachnospiraceae bacterium]|nr:GGDEF domain-containing protein [Lachnospiraceae bacterium]